MNKNLVQIKQTISNLETQEIVNLLGIGLNMAQKYKRFTHLPRLDSAILMEDNLGIPARAWVELKNLKDSTK